ncbi:hypothetical protein HDU96_006747 [Phlyctochytrium bullatum]|nr:hypothetical protein HDU96_006747 [Phlyctochytrium bullatum]
MRGQIHIEEMAGKQLFTQDAVVTSGDSTFGKAAEAVVGEIESGSIGVVVGSEMDTANRDDTAVDAVITVCENMETSESSVKTTAMAEFSSVVEAVDGAESTKDQDIDVFADQTLKVPTFVGPADASVPVRQNTDLIDINETERPSLTPVKAASTDPDEALLASSSPPVVFGASGSTVLPHDSENAVQLADACIPDDHDTEPSAGFKTRQDEEVLTNTDEVSVHVDLPLAVVVASPAPVPPPAIVVAAPAPASVVASAPALAIFSLSPAPETSTTAVGSLLETATEHPVEVNSTNASPSRKDSSSASSASSKSKAKKRRGKKGAKAKSKPVAAIKEAESGSAQASILDAKNASGEARKHNEESGTAAIPEPSLGEETTTDLSDKETKDALAGEHQSPSGTSSGNVAEDPAVEIPVATEQTDELAVAQSTNPSCDGHVDIQIEVVSATTECPISDKAETLGLVEVEDASTTAGTFADGKSELPEEALTTAEKLEVNLQVGAAEDLVGAVAGGAAIVPKPSPEEPVPAVETVMKTSSDRPVTAVSVNLVPSREVNNQRFSPSSKTKTKKGRGKKKGGKVENSGPVAVIVAAVSDSTQAATLDDANASAEASIKTNDESGKTIPEPTLKETTAILSNPDMKDALAGEHSSASGTSTENVAKDLVVEIPVATERSNESIAVAQGTEPSGGDEGDRLGPIQIEEASANTDSSVGDKTEMLGLIEVEDASTIAGTSVDVKTEQPEEALTTVEKLEVNLQVGAPEDLARAIAGGVAIVPKPVPEAPIPAVEAAMMTLSDRPVTADSVNLVPSPEVINQPSSASSETKTKNGRGKKGGKVEKSSPVALIEGAESASAQVAALEAANASGEAEVKIIDKADIIARPQHSRGESTTVLEEPGMKTVLPSTVDHANPAVKTAKKKNKKSGKKSAQKTLPPGKAGEKIEKIKSLPEPDRPANVSALSPLSEQGSVSTLVEEPEGGCPPPAQKCPVPTSTDTTSPTTTIPSKPPQNTFNGEQMKKNLRKLTFAMAAARAMPQKPRLPPANIKRELAGYQIPSVKFTSLNPTASRWLKVVSL